MAKKNKPIIVILLSLVVVFVINKSDQNSQESNNINIESLYKSKASGKIVVFEASVEKILTDDIKGDKHQRLILKTNKRTILLAHNIDVAPRIPVKIHDNIKIKGMYEWNEKGGVVHWTHHDPQNRREGGWIELNGKKYK